MQQFGLVNGRKIFYTNVRRDSEWFKKLPGGNWCAFTITDDEDSDLVDLVVEKSLKNQMAYVCNTGQLADKVELSFDLKIVEKAIEQESITKIPFDYDQSPITTAHKNFGEGFWFSLFAAQNEENDINTVICIDFTKKGVKNNIQSLIEKINNDWLPSEEEIELPYYDE
ncbi:hypothetical protein [Pedobacter sp. UBA5917]|jgi:hypothetical protein|uniref:hypothetical protein n=1 Tax=Pedobacter sp. UBA5917 TaxID=1947061 RepID=UPI002600726F|nr:hypothetical protein [Pedobacter sp. UBA5917]